MSGAARRAKRIKAICESKYKKNRRGQFWTCDAAWGPPLRNEPLIIGCINRRFPYIINHRSRATQKRKPALLKISWRVSTRREREKDTGEDTRKGALSVHVGTKLLSHASRLSSYLLLFRKISNPPREDPKSIPKSFTYCVFLSFLSFFFFFFSSFEGSRLKVFEDVWGCLSEF